MIFKPLSIGDVSSVMESLIRKGPNREAIQLYRDILRACRHFHWCNDKGEPWNEVLRKNARKEFEEARHERVGFFFDLL